jgi:hypothetical protein
MARLTAALSQTQPSWAANAYGAVAMAQWQEWGRSLTRSGNKVFYTGAGKSVLIGVPDLPKALDRIAMAFNPKEAKKIYRKALMAGGRIILKTAKALVPKRGRIKKGDKGIYGKTGLTKKSLKIWYRTGRRNNTSYILVGADRSVMQKVKRGRQEIDAIPSKTIHLVERGFTAVSRIPGIVGRETHYEILKRLRKVGGRGTRSISMANALKQGLDKKLITSNHRTPTVFSTAAYLRGYRKATKTKVPGAFFMRRAKQESADAAIAKAREVMQKEYQDRLSIFRVK